MKTPIYSFLKKYSSSSAVRLHMPGHKGKYARADITEIPGADVLYNTSGIIRESEDNASALFGSARTIYSTEGSSLCIRAMLYLVKLYAKSRGEEPLVLAARNAHFSFVSAAALLDIDVKWIYPKDGSLLSCHIDLKALEEKISALSPTCVYITSPDYLGNVADIEKISEACKKHGCLLLVDNAHGAYFKFLPILPHPLDAGADICCDSAHKTLPVLTGGAYLHISRSCPQFFSQNAEAAMRLFASTSPSYLILESLDKANMLLADNFSARISKVAKRVEKLRISLTEHGFSVMGDEPLKLTLLPKSFGYTGNELSSLLFARNIVCEFSDSDFLVMMFSANTTGRDLRRLRRTLLGVIRRRAVTSFPPPIFPAKSVLPAREALFSEKVRKKADDCEGSIFAGASISCPPAIPIVIYGEEINKPLIECMKYYGVSECEVVAKR